MLNETSNRVEAKCVIFCELLELMLEEVESFLLIIGDNLDKQPIKFCLNNIRIVFI